MMAAAGDWVSTWLPQHPGAVGLIVGVIIGMLIKDWLKK